MLKFWHVTVWLVCLIPSWGQTANHGTGTSSVQKIEKWVQEGRYDEAEKELQLAKSSDNSNPRLKFLHCVVQAQQANVKKAIACFQQWSQEHPDVPEAYNNIGVLYAGLGMPVEARKWLELGLKQQQAYFRLHQNLLNLQSEMNRQAYAAALQLDMTKQTAQPKLSLLARITSAPDQSLMVASVNGADKPTLSAVNKSSANATTTTPALTLPTPTPKPVVSPSAAVVAQAEPEKEVNSTAVLAQQSRIQEAVLAWSSAWSRKDVDAYIKSYASGFNPGAQLSRAAWEEQRRSRILSKKQIQIELAQIKVQMSENSANATVTFVQKYEAGAVVTVSRKTLEMVEEKGRWLISREFVIGS